MKQAGALILRGIVLIGGMMLIGVMMLITRVMVMIGVMTAPCETLKADGMGAGQQLGNMLLPVEHACEKGSRWERGKDWANI